MGLAAGDRPTNSNKDALPLHPRQLPARFSCFSLHVAGARSIVAGGGRSLLGTSRYGSMQQNAALALYANSSISSRDDGGSSRNSVFSQKSANTNPVSP